MTAIGLSVLSGAHLVLFKRVLDLLKEHGAGDILVIGGGTIPPKDVARLKELGVSEVFTSGTPANTIVERLRSLLDQHQESTRPTTSEPSSGKSRRVHAETF